MDDEQDYVERWDRPSLRRQRPGEAFCFREAGMTRFNDVYDRDEEDGDPPSESCL